MFETTVVQAARHVFIATGLLLLSFTTVVAEPVGPKAPRREDTAFGQSVVIGSRPIAFPVRGVMRIDVDVRVNGNAIISERHVPGGDVESIELLSHPQAQGHLAALRHQDSRNPGRVTLRLWQDGVLVVETSLSQFYQKYGITDDSSDRPPDIRPQHGTQISTQGQCEDTCALLYDECMLNCDPMGSACATCWTWYQDCIGECPDCEDWEEVSRTLIGRRFTGGANIVGWAYCNYDEYYLVEETNPAGCYPNRFVCETDSDTMLHEFPSSSIPDESDCCDANDDPGDEHYCAGDTCS